MKKKVILIFSFLAIVLFSEPSATIYGGDYLHREGNQVSVQIKLHEVSATAADFTVTFLDNFGAKLSISRKVGTDYFTDNGTFIYTGLRVEDASLTKGIYSLKIKIVTADGSIMELPTEIKGSD